MILDSGNSYINKIATNSLRFNERRLVLNKQKIEKEKKTQMIINAMPEIKIGWCDKKEMNGNYMLCYQNYFFEEVS